MTSGGNRACLRGEKSAQTAENGPPCRTKSNWVGRPPPSKTHDAHKYDLMSVWWSSLTLIFIIMRSLTRALVAAAVIVGTASANSIAASFGLSCSSGRTFSA